MVRRVGKVLQDEVDHTRDTSGNRFTEPHPAVHHNAAVPEVEDLQVLEVAEVGLKVRDQLQGGHKSICEDHVFIGCQKIV